MKESRQQQILQQLETELAALKDRARAVDYKNQLPKLPKVKPNIALETRLVGFQKRLTNWTLGLLLAENPNGLPSVKKIELEPAVETIGSTVINSLSDLAQIVVSNDN